MEIIKSSWQTDQNSIRFSVPFAKVDAEHRTVSGFATLDNVDRTADICTAEASNKAFERFRGNVREMHQSIAVGKVLGFSQQDFYDFSTDKTYRGIFVTAYVSKGAQDTWEKVLDGTLSGFSIGGNIIESDVVFDAEINQSVRVIKEYDLVELSLVDSPANNLANIFSIVKSDTGAVTYKGMAFETSVSSVFYCEGDKIAVVSSEESQNCASCNKNMENIGWIESADSEKSDVLRDVVQKYLNPDPEITKQDEVNTHEGGIEVDILSTSVEEVEPIEKADEVVDEVAVEAADEAVVDAVDVVAEEEAVEEVEKADEGSEVEAVDAPVDFVKLFDDLRSFVADTVTKSTEASNEQVAGVRASVEAFVKSVDEKFNELGTTHETLAKSVTDLTESLKDVEARVEGLNSSTAVKKSSELGGSEEVLQKNTSIWGGRFLGVSDL